MTVAELIEMLSALPDICRQGFAIPSSGHRAGRNPRCFSLIFGTDGVLRAVTGPRPVTEPAGLRQRFFLGR